MSDTGFKTASTIATNAWTVNMSASQIATSDNAYAAAQGTTFLAATSHTFGFGLSSGINIDGIEIAGEINDNTGGQTGTLQLSLSWDSGTSWTATKSNTQTGTTDVTRTYGGAADTWGRTWAYTEFADGTFRIKMEGKSSTAGSSLRLDYLAVKVYYSIAATNTAGFFLAFLGGQG